jgi:hypothetical protein|tara:strand:+ start:203 stop:370 length:168 start_codon:yes stop_codon:yes gene_type:complete
MAKHIFKERDEVVVPINGERIDAIIIDVLDTMLFVQYDKGQGFVYKAEAVKKGTN